MEVDVVIKERGFFDVKMNPSSYGFPNNYKVQHSGMVIYDHASGLKWQQSGSQHQVSYEEAIKYVNQLNCERFVGFSDWRLPTVEEAMSLMEPTKMEGKHFLPVFFGSFSLKEFDVLANAIRKNNLYIDPVFDYKQWIIFTSDTGGYNSGHWVVDFGYGYCYNNLVFYGNTCVRAVR